MENFKFIHGGGKFLLFFCSVLVGDPSLVELGGISFELQRMGGWRRCDWVMNQKRVANSVFAKANSPDVKGGLKDLCRKRKGSGC